MLVLYRIYTRATREIHVKRLLSGYQARKPNRSPSQPAVFILSPEPAVSFLFIDRFYSVSLYFLCFLRQAPFSSPLGRLGTRLGVQQVIPPPEAT